MIKEFKRKILLVEPNYKNKYPPIGLMKIATYHKILGDSVVFFKGDLRDLVIRDLVDQCILKLNKIDSTIDWELKYKEIFKFIKYRKKSTLLELQIDKSNYEQLVSNTLEFYKNKYFNKEYNSEHRWDRIYVATLFTFYWDITINTINFCKNLVSKKEDIWVGGVMASVIPSEIKLATGVINVHVGLLNKKGILDDNEIIIDELPLDYSILHEIDYKYPESDAYYGYTTRGCIRKCAFCAVPIIEPKYNDRIEISSFVRNVELNYGAKRNLLLLDNNVLASNKFADIIEEIKLMGFDKKTKYHEPNHLELALQNLNNGINDHGYKKRIVELLNEFVSKIKTANRQEVYNLLYENKLLDIHTAKIETIKKIVPDLLDLYEKVRNKIPKNRYVDFNQGVDARLLTEEKAKILSQIPIRPLRIAFDNIKYKDYYVEAIYNAHKHGIKHFSNYLLYNFLDKPIELYQRLLLNIELCEELAIDIYSFPMKYHPIFGEYNMNRDYIGKFWNRKYIRAVQVILNATKGKIGRGKSFFFKAFGKDEIEFNNLLYMPEPYLLYRKFFENEGLTSAWEKSFYNLNHKNINLVKNIIEKNDFRNIDVYASNNNIYDVLKHYKITRDYINDKSKTLSELDVKFDLKSSTNMYECNCEVF